MIMALRAVFRHRIQSGRGQDCGCPVPLIRPSPRGEGERWDTAGKFGRCGCSPRFSVHRFGAARQPRLVVLSKHWRMFLPLPKGSQGGRALGRRGKIRTFQLQSPLPCRSFRSHTTTKAGRIIKARANASPSPQGPQGRGRGEGEGRKLQPNTHDDSRSCQTSRVAPRGFPT
jgi:hypothetical protein